MQGTVLVLNAGYEPLHVVSLKKAIHMLYRGVAVIDEYDPNETFGPYQVPKVLRLVRYIAMKWSTRGEPDWTRDRLLARDNRTCGYCGKPATTVDHITPKSKGGRLTWMNTVAACLKCNGMKADHTPAQAGMTLLVTPYVPSILEIHVAAKANKMEDALVRIRRRG